jgi:hypothetical protein
MEYVKTFEAFIDKDEKTGTIKDKFDNVYNYHFISTRHEIRLTITNKKNEVISYIKLEHDITENFWEVEEVDINEKYKRHGLYLSMLKECLSIVESKKSKGIVSRKYPIHKKGQRTTIMDMFWENIYKEQSKENVIITKKEASDDKEGWDYYIQLK